MQKQKKTWVKSTTLVLSIGKCRYCNKEMDNTESFVAFADKTKAHYECMRLDDAKRAEDKTFE
jgi:hypothetical protein|tara:strand:+ start:419 stop:607 length:189 start_codon:yes stop_codon:yes gene_type:complete